MLTVNTLNIPDSSYTIDSIDTPDMFVTNVMF